MIARVRYLLGDVWKEKDIELPKGLKLINTVNVNNAVTSALCKERIYPREFYVVYLAGELNEGAEWGKDVFEVKKQILSNQN